MSALDSLWCDEVPADVLRLIERFELATAEARTVIERQAEQIRSRAEAEIAGIQQRADEAIQTQARALAEEIKPLLEEYIRAGKLGEALAIRERLRGLRTCLLDALPDPGYLHLTPEDYGKTFLYEVTGEAHHTGIFSHGVVWGTDIYCGDSTLAGTCVHAGVLKPGETGVVRVTVLDRPHPSFQGTSRNGVLSHSWQGHYPAFRVSRA